MMGSSRDASLQASLLQKPEGAPEIFEDSSYTGMDSGGVTALLEAPNRVFQFSSGGFLQGLPQNGWLIVGNPTKMEDLGLPPFQETSR